MICLDNIIFSLQQNGGISVYWAELMQGLLQSDLPLQVIERGDAVYNYKRQGLGLPDKMVYPERSLPLLLSRYLPVAGLPAGGRVWHSSYYRPCLTQGIKQIFTVYDCIYERHSTGVKRLAHTWQKGMAIRHAERIICISHSTASDLLQYYPDIPPERLCVIHLGCSDSYRPLVDAALDDWGQQNDGQFVLFVGEREGYKNFKNAVQAVGMLEGMKLVAVGGGVISSQEQQMVNQYLPGRFMHHSYLTEEKLNLLYNQARCLLYTSEYEGFGLPPPLRPCRQAAR